LSTTTRSSPFFTTERSEHAAKGGGDDEERRLQRRYWHFPLPSQLTHSCSRHPVVFAKIAICATELGNNAKSRRCSSHDDGYGLRTVFRVSGIVMSGAILSHVDSCS
jgi:hypothetical protein